MSEELPIVIKKYANRRLYNMQTSCYITLTDVYDMLKREEMFIVRDAKTNKDLTHSVLLQVVLEKEEAASSLFNNTFLRMLIGLYDHPQKSQISTYLQHMLHHYTLHKSTISEEETIDTRI